MTAEIQCAACGTVNEVSLPVARKEECTRCRVDLRACRHCAFYDPAAHNACRDTSAEPVRDKEKANPCEFFRPRATGMQTGPSREALRAAAEALFKNKG